MRGWYDCLQSKEKLFLMFADIRAATGPKIWDGQAIRAKYLTNPDFYWTITSYNNYCVYVNIDNRINNTKKKYAAPFRWIYPSGKLYAMTFS